MQLICPKSLNPSRHTLVGDFSQQLVGLGAGLLWQCRQAFFHGGALGLRLLFGGQAQAILGLRGLLRLHRYSGPPFIHSSSGHLGDRATVRVQAQILAGLAGRLVLPGQQRSPATGHAAQHRAHRGRPCHALCRVKLRVERHRCTLAFVLGHTFFQCLLCAFHGPSLQGTRGQAATKALGTGHQALGPYQATSSTNGPRNHTGTTGSSQRLLIRGTTLARQLIGRASSIATGRGHSKPCTSCQASARSRLGPHSQRTYRCTRTTHSQARPSKRTCRLGCRKQRVTRHVAQRGRDFITKALGLLHFLGVACLLGLDHIRLLVLASFNEILVNPLRRGIARAHEIGHR